MDKTTGIPFDPESGRASHLSFPVVGIGASAGGLVALKRFFEHLPAETGMAFVIVLHLSPKHESTADQILARCTRMPVLQVRERVPIEPNHVYVISPQNDLRMDDGQLAVAPSQRPRGQHVAIDLFFRTLGEVHGDRAIAVVLSGTGADGSVGITRVKEHGGVTLAQSPEDCEYEDMPRNAITTGRVDFVLPAADLPQKLIDLWKNAQRIELPPAPEAHGHIAPTPPDTRPDTEQALRDILDMLAARSGHDFRHYKRATVLRRIERRLQVNMLPDLPAYRDFLRANPEETARLLDDMLISVTNFFRDREAFEALEREVIPALFAEHVADEQVRVWVPACATGEEAYSVAMLLADHAATLAAPPGFQVFASDIDERGLSVGRAGSYPESIITDVPPSRLRQFFNKEQQRYRITKAIRDHVLFAQHNVLRDPPFSKLDMVCCRNLLIYLDREIQARLLEVFHFALRPGGLLFLGSSESADAASRHFDVVDKKHRIYRARNLAHSLPATVLPLRAAERRHAPLGTPAPARERRGFSFAEVHQRVLEHYAPPSVIVDRESNIVHMSDRAGRFLHFVGGEPSHNLLTVVHPELRLELRTALFQAVHTGKSVEARRVKIDRGGKPFFVNMVARPFRDPEAGAEFVLVLFDEVEDTMSADAGVASGERDAVMLHLEEELHRTKERLQATIEQSETSNEELKASNEELQAINEELRSATEELETSKEELQSVNEELITVNYELKTKVEETAKVNDDLRNFIASTDIATVFVDAGLRIRRYTPRAEDIFNIIPGDVGRCLLDITHRLDYPELAADATSAFEVLRPVEREVRSLDGRLFAARALPYRTQENRIDGAVLTFVDITRLRMAQERVDVAEDQLRVAATHAASHAMLVFDADGRITAWNAGAEQMFGYGVAEMNGQPVARLASPDDDGAERMRLQMREADRTGHAEAEYWCLRKDGSRVFCNSLLTPLQNGGFDGYIQVLADASRRVADVERTNAQLTSAISQRAKAEAESALKDDFLAVMSHELKNPLNLISVNTELVARAPEVRDSPLVQQSLEGIRRAIRGQTKIIDDLLDMSRIRTGKLKLSVTAVDLGALVESIVEVARADVSSAAVDIGCTLGDTPSLVHADPLRLEQIIWNLLGNAIKFTPAGGQVRIAVQAEDRFCRLTVRDTGQGIEPYFLPRLFEMFSQVPGRALSGKSGLGIGLAVVREIVTLHGGRIEAASDGPGRGSTFTVWLPRVMPVVSRARKALPAPHENPWDGLQLLVVDDTAATVDGLARLLEMEGATVLRAYGGEEALDLLRRETVDVVLSDLGMPGIDGYELARRVRADPRMATLPMVALTGFAREGDVRESVAAGFTAHVGKPIVLESLAEVVAQALKATTQDD